MCRCVTLARRAARASPCRSSGGKRGRIPINLNFRAESNDFFDLGTDDFIVEVHVPEDVDGDPLAKLSVRDQIALEVKTSQAQLDAARHEVDVANLGVKLAQEEVGQARDRFQAGVTNNIEVISAQNSLARANDNQIVALYRYNQSRADLARSVGQMEALYAK